MIRIFFAAVAALIFTSMTAYAYDIRTQLLRHMTLDTEVISKREQVADKISCDPGDQNSFMLIGLGNFNESQNHLGATPTEKRQALISGHHWPMHCALVTKARGENGTEVEILTVILPTGEYILSGFENEIWTWWEWEEKHGFEIIERQHPQKPDLYVAVTN